MSSAVVQPAGRVVRGFAWILIWLCCVAVAAWGVLALPASAIFGTGRRAWRLAVAFDQLGNTAAGGSEDETFSSRCWRNRHVARYAALVVFIDWIFLRLAGEESHCRNAFEAEMLSCKNLQSTTGA